MLPGKVVTSYAEHGSASEGGSTAPALQGACGAQRRRKILRGLWGKGGEKKH